MLVLSGVITLGALARNESRGAHYKPEFPDRDDANWLKTTRAKWVNCDVQLAYEPVDISLIKDRKSTRLNSSHVSISYAVFCLKKKKARVLARRLSHYSDGMFAICV